MYKQICSRIHAHAYTHAHTYMHTLIYTHRPTYIIHIK